MLSYNRSPAAVTRLCSSTAAIRIGFVNGTVSARYTGAASSASRAIHLKTTASTASVATSRMALYSDSPRIDS